MDRELLTSCIVVAGFKTRKEFAKALNVHPATITKWINGTNRINKKWKEKVIQALSERNLSQEDIYVLSQLKK